MPRPCKHETNQAGCPWCAWCLDPSEKGVLYRRRWGEPEPPAANALPAWKQRMLLATSCTHRGTPTGATTLCGECGARHVQLSVLTCAVHGTCTERVAADRGVRSCKGCADRVAPEGVVSARLPAVEWISTARLTLDSITLAGMLPQSCVGVAGIPRSGMLSAAVIATHLHLPLYQFAEEGRLERLGHGSRGRNLRFPDRPGTLAVIDDTVYGGGAMRKARAHIARLKRPAVFAAVYVRPESATAVDLYVKELPSPHLLEWNWANNGPLTGHAANPIYGRGIATDLDGIICHDERSGGVSGTPYMLPRTRACPLIVTGRVESSRGVTEGWLRRWGVLWERLEMFPDASPWSWEAVASFKAARYKASGCGFFLESCPIQAAKIHAESGLPVICPIEGKVHQ